LQPDSQSEHQVSEERLLFGPLEFLLVHAQSTRLDSTRNSYSGELVKEGAVCKETPCGRVTDSTRWTRRPVSIGVSTAQAWELLAWSLQLVRHVY